MTLHLVRHAQAGDRLRDADRDFQRPLVPAGLEQADSIADELASRPVERILASPFARCVGTIEPLAERLGLEVELVGELAEATSIDRTVGLLRSLAGETGDSVMCSHGDVIPATLVALVRAGLNISDRYRCEMASIWELTVVNGEINGAVYRRPGTFGAAAQR